MIRPQSLARTASSVRLRKARLVPYGLDMSLDGAQGYMELFGNGRIAFTGHHLPQNLQLPAGQQVAGDVSELERRRCIRVDMPSSTNQAIAAK